MSVIALVFFCLASAAAGALGCFFFVGKYNMLITLRKHAWQAWIDLTAADLQLASELRDHGFGTEADLLEEAAHYAVAGFGQPLAPEHLSSVRARALACTPDYRAHLDLTRDYEAKANFYNKALYDPCCSLVVRCCGLCLLPK